MLERFRTWLYAPGDRPDRCRKAMATHADQVIWDLEDAVSEDRKTFARDTVTALLKEPFARKPWVRVNGWDTEWGLKDFERLHGVLGNHLRVVVPKATLKVAQALQEYGFSGEWLFIIETAQGLADVMDMKTPWPVNGQARFAFGALDYRNDMGALETADEVEITLPRSLLVLASRVWGWLAPIDAVFPGIADGDAVEASSRRARVLGMAGKMIIHPQQIAPVHRAYAPRPEDVDWAEEVMKAAQSAGAVKVRGAMVDRPVIERARQILKETNEGGEA